MKSNNTFSSLLIFCFVFFGITPYTLAQSSTDEIYRSIESYFVDWDQPDKPGGAIAVVQDGEVVYSEVFGYADIENSVPVDSRTKFNVQALHNQVVAYAVLLLETEGKLSLEDKASKFLPELVQVGSEIRIKHLLTHTHGLPDFIAMQLVAGSKMEDIKTRNEALNLLFKLEEPSGKPGDRYNYSPSGFLLASEIIERVSGVSYSEFVKTQLFEPLGMTNTTYRESPDMIIKNRARPYSQNSDAFVNETENYFCLNDFALFSTAEDMAKWLVNLGNPQIGEKALIKKLSTPASLNDGTVTEAALGLFVNTHKGLNYIQHNAMAYGNLAFIARFPDQNLGIVVLGNSYNFNALEIAFKTVDLYLQEHIDKEVIAEMNDTSGELPKPETITLSTKELEKFCGSYFNNAESYSRSIVIRNGKLFYRRSEGNESELAAIDKNTFILVSNPTEYSIRFEKKGEKQMMIFRVGDEFAYEHEKYKPATYTTEQLNALVGNYFCPTLGTLYELKMVDGTLVAEHFRKGQIRLSPTKKDQFGGDQWYFSNIVFSKSKNQQIDGFTLSTTDAGNHFFKKL